MKKNNITIFYEEDETNFLENSQNELEDTNETPLEN